MGSKLTSIDQQLLTSQYPDAVDLLSPAAELPAPTKTSGAAPAAPMHKTQSLAGIELFMGMTGLALTAFLGLLLVGVIVFNPLAWPIVIGYFIVKHIAAKKAVVS